MANVLSQLGLFGTPEGDYNSALTLEGTGTADGTSTSAAVQEQDYTTLGLGGYSTTSPLKADVAVTQDFGAGLATGTSVVDGQATALWNAVGLAAGVATAEAYYTSLESYTTLGLGGFSQSYPLYEASTSAGETTGSAYGTCLVEGSADTAIVEDIGSPDVGYLGPVLGTGAATVAQNILVVTPSGGFTFSGTAPRLKGFSYTAVGGLTLAGTARAVKTRTVISTGGILFSGTGSGASNQQKSYTYTPTGGIVFGGTGSTIFFKNYGPGATGKIRDKRRITNSTRAYSRG